MERDSLLEKWFNETGNAIQKSIASKENRALTHIVELERKLRRDRAFFNEDFERSAAYLTEIFLRSLHGNLFLDTPFSEELQEEKDQLVSYLGEAMIKMSEKIKSGDQVGFFASLGNVVNHYLDIVEAANLRFQEKLTNERKGA